MAKCRQGRLWSPSQLLLLSAMRLLLLLLTIPWSMCSAASEGLRSVGGDCQAGESAWLPKAGGRDGTQTKVLGTASCKETYRRFYENHTACLAPSASAAYAGLQEYLKEHIVKLHNRYRGRVGDEAWQRQPTASNMQQMYWDEELALLAQAWASQCRFYHEAPAGRYIPGSYSVGQNLATGHVNWDAAIRHWYSEVIELNFGVGKRGLKAAVGHYTQLVWADSSRVGCGFAKCNKTSTPFYVCNYGPTGNYPSIKYTPYLAGKKGSLCPHTLKDGLCDCGGKACKNKGVLNVTSCQCTCPKLDWISGEDCSLDCALAADSPLCSTKGGHLVKDDCQLLEDVAFGLCPIMCGLCAGAAARNAAAVDSDCMPGIEGDAIATGPPDAPVTASRSSEKESKLARLRELLGLDAEEQPSRAASAIQLESRSQAHHAKAAAENAGGGEKPQAALAHGSDLQEREAKLRWLKARLGLDLGSPQLPAAAGHGQHGRESVLASVHPQPRQELASFGVKAASTTAPRAPAAAGRATPELKDLWDRLLFSGLARAKSARPAT